MSDSKCYVHPTLLSFSTSRETLSPEVNEPNSRAGSGSADELGHHLFKVREQAQETATTSQKWHRGFLLVLVQLKSREVSYDRIMQQFYTYRKRFTTGLCVREEGGSHSAPAPQQAPKRASSGSPRPAVAARHSQTCSLTASVQPGLPGTALRCALDSAHSAYID